MNEDLKIIKKKYGEEMMHFCRESFSTILDEEGKLSQLLLDHFEPNHKLYYDINKHSLINEFKDYIFELIKSRKDIYITDKTPEELLDEAGYTLFECHTEKDIQIFKKYYKKREELCTFKGNRLDYCRVFFAVRKNVNEIKREDYPIPERQDEYGTSVISIQFTRKNNILSIKNRYNHTVVNPDATFSNNLDNIIPGLTHSFEKYYGIVQKYKSSQFEIPGYKQVDGKYYSYNVETNNYYYCANNIVIYPDNTIKRLEKERYIVMDYFLLDLQNKIIKMYDKDINVDSFIDGLEDIKDIKIEKRQDSKIIYITPNNGDIIEIELNEDNSIISYKNPNLTEIKDYFMERCYHLKYIDISNVEKIGNDFLIFNADLKEISLPKVTSVGRCFLYKTPYLEKIYMPEVEIVYAEFLANNRSLTELYLPKVKIIYSNALLKNEKIKKVYLPHVIKIGAHFLKINKSLDEIEAPMLKECDINCLKEHQTIKLENIISENRRREGMKK